tara:strand:- start:604 stop:1608 length:1005 start_codon:yes stop_codon:yes gene_type:complete
MINNKLKVGVIGSVKATEIILKCLNHHSFKNVKVWGYNPLIKENISGWVDLNIVSKKYHYEYEDFKKINDKELSIKSFKPELLFIVGLSQLVKKEILEIPKFGSIGFHPTVLPKGRGRAPLAWLILDKQKLGAATFFKIKDGIDNGPIIEQIFFDIKENDYVSDLDKKMIDAEILALERILTNSNFPLIKGFDQDDRKATFYGKRNPSDGLINWKENKEDIISIIKACSKPHPGAFTYSEDNKIIIFKAKLSDIKFKGVIGRILKVNNKNSFIVQTGNGLIEILDWFCINEEWVPKVGILLGYSVQNEIFQLKRMCSELNNKLSKLENEENIST